MLYVYGTTIKLTRGDSAFLTFPLEMEDTREAYELSAGDVLEFAIKRCIHDQAPAVSKRLVGDNTFSLQPADTADLPFGRYVYDVQLTTEDGQVYTVINRATIELMEEVI
jgi:hypothetical protein